MGAGFFDCVLMRARHQLGTVAAPANRFADPQAAHMEPSTPYVAEQAAEDFAAATSYEKADRVVIREAGDRDIVLIDAANDGFAPRVRRIRLADNFHFGHFPPHSRTAPAGPTAQTAGCIARYAGSYLIS